MTIRCRAAALLACAVLVGSSSARAQSAPAARAAEEGERALERALSRQSVLVLPRGVYELEPAIEYTFRGSNALELFDVSGMTQVARQIVKQDRLEARLSLRAGLPHSSHVEIRVPYVFVRDDRTTADPSGRTVHESGGGDLELGFTRELVAEQPARAGWLASLNWRVPTGRFRLGEPSPGSGFHALQGALTAVKRQDPLVFFATASYTYVHERRHQGVGIDPGNSVGLKLGTLLAASPQTSLRGAFEVSRSGRTGIDGVRTRGSDSAVATLQLGLATLLSRRSLLDIELGIGVTSDAPDFSVTASLPFRFQ